MKNNDLIFELVMLVMGIILGVLICSVITLNKDITLIGTTGTVENVIVNSDCTYTVTLNIPVMYDAYYEQIKLITVNNYNIGDTIKIK